MIDAITTEQIEENIAIIGMSGRFPGAKNIDEFWQNLKNGVESITFFSEQELIDSGIDPSVLKDSHYVKAKGILDDVTGFDAAFFGFSPKEAEITDPQQRLFLECAWEALENAGYEPQNYSGAIGLYGGMSGIDTYLSQNLSLNKNIRNSTDKFQLLIGNDKDFLCTRIAYKLNLNGPSVTVQTACSSGLVAVVMACKSLLTYQCDMVLAGGVAISLPVKSGYFYQEGMILSPDGHCRAFDSKAQGTVLGNGVGFVVLKRLEEAISDGDHIYAIIKGAAINNDGSNKVGYTAPSVAGQMQVIAEALAFAETPAKTIRYIETHGTGTPLGDPIEIAALTQVFRAETEQKKYCAIGSVKTNIGHLDTAAGIAGLIKTVLALKHQLIPPSLHFDSPNPKLDLDNSPFYVNTQLSEWKKNAFPRRAGVSAFGIGGTNAHVILEEAPQPKANIPPPKSERPWQLLLLSARTDSALESATIQLVEHFKQHPNLNLADVAYTYQVGRRAFNHRRMLVCKTLAQAINALSTQDEVKAVFSHTVKDNENPSVVFMFSGQGSQYVNMGLELYETEAVFREQVDRCAQWLNSHLGLDLRTVLYPNETQQTELAIQELNQTALTQPALFVIEYALAQLWMAYGIQPKAMIGHSIGEYVAACLAGVFTLEEALMLVAVRGKLMQSLPVGAMLAVPLSEAAIQPLLNKEIDLAAINVPTQCVVSGTDEAITQFAMQLAKQGIECQRLHTSHAFHSEMMSPILTPFLEQVQQIQLKAPKIPFISNVTGNWITHTEATTPNYWLNHIRQTVRFAPGLQKLFKKQAYILLEIGPGRTLSTLAKQHSESAGQFILTSLRHPKEKQSDSAFFLNSLGQLWLAGMTVNWAKFHASVQRYRLPLPSYPFERQRYWIEPQNRVETLQAQSDGLHKKPDIADWFYIPSWKRMASKGYHAKVFTESLCWLVFMDDCGLGAQLVKRLQQQAQEVIIVTVGKEFTHDGQKYTLNPHKHDHYDALLQELLVQKKRPKRIIHLWNVTANTEIESELEWLDRFQDLVFYSLLFLAQALGKQNFTDVLQIGVVSNHLQAVTGDEMLRPEKATLLGPCKVIPQEYPNITCRTIDIMLPDELANGNADKLIELLLMDLIQGADSTIAYRGRHRWVQIFEPIRLTQQSSVPQKLRDKGVYLITGGLGGIGLVLAEYLAKTVQAKLILTMRSSFPAKNEWQQWLENHNEQDSISRKIKKVQTLEALGAEVLIISADVAHIEQMQCAITQSLEEFGQIHGVIHAAGLPTGGVIQRKTAELTENSLTAKVIGTLILENLFRQVKLDFFVLCSSINSILGIFGQVDYCAANAFLDAFAHYKTSTGLLTISINWDIWQEVGMAAEIIKQHKKNINLTQDAHYKKIIHPLFDKYLVDEKTGTETYVTYFNPSKHWMLSEHKVMGKPTLPGTTYLEMARAAVERNAKNTEIFEFKTVSFILPLTVTENEEKEVRLLLTKRGTEFEFVIVSQTHSGGIWQEYASGQIKIYRDAEWHEQYDIRALEEKCQETEIVFSQETLTTSSGIAVFGPRWNNLKLIKVGVHQELAYFELPESYMADLKEYYWHPALLDVAIGFTVLKMETAYLPFSYKKLRIKGRLPAKIYSYITFIEPPPPNSVKLNIKIMDEQGHGLAEIEEFILRKVDTEKPFKQLESENFRLQSLPMNQAMPTGNTNIFQKELKEGLLPTEGIEVFKRILHSQEPQVLVSTLDLSARLREKEDIFSTRLSASKNSSAKPLPKSKHSRPQLNSAYIAPRNQLEHKITEVWENFLGIDNVGIHDDFFGLGGDSFMAVQLVSKLQKTLQVELYIHSLLEKSTIANLAESIQAIPIKETQTSSLVLPPSLVKIQAGNPLKQPIFLVHPGGGRVYYFRYLAHYLGSEQPVYGFEAQGIDGKAEPLTQIEAMATHYIKAMRVVQPEGPYVIGGASFGGIVAFEMAQQLNTLQQKVELLFMMDSAGPGQLSVKNIDDVTLLAYVLGFGLKPTLGLSLEQLNQLDLEQQIYYLFDSGEIASRAYPKEAISEIRHFLHLLKIDSQTMNNYVPKTYHGKILFFRALERDSFIPKNPEKYWQNLATGELLIHEIPGYHVSINLQPNVKVMADHLKAYLDKIN
jgi:acyl transferase domain-containing protein